MRLFGKAGGSSTPLIGREDECALLSSLFQKVIQKSETPLEVCLVHGEAGSGKTSVIRHVAAEQQKLLGKRKDKTLHFVSGKFDQYRDISSPYAVIVNAFEQILSNSVSSSKNSIKNGADRKATVALRKRIKACITTEARILTKIIPSFRWVVEEFEEPTFSVVSEQNKEEEPSFTSEAAASITEPSVIANIATAAAENTANEGQRGTVAGGNTGSAAGGKADEVDNEVLALASERLIVAFRVFLREFCCPEHPMILFVDDLQWGDKNSFQVLSQIANDTSIKNFLLLGCYRDESHERVLNMLSLDPSNRHVTNLSVGPLDADQVDSLVDMVVSVERRSSIQSLDDNDEQSEISTSEFGMLVHRRTQGNPYFVVQFLEMLHSRKLLTYNYGSQKWNFALSQIEESTNVSDNVVDVLKARLGELPSEVQQVLIIASFLGFMVDTKLLEALILDMSMIDRLGVQSSNVIAPEKKMTTAAALKIAQEEGLMEITSHGNGSICRFTHDKIQECFYAQVPEGSEQDHLHFQMGMKVWRQYLDQDQANPAYVFLAADQLNRGAGCIRRDEDRIFLIEINYKASQSAKSRVGIETVSMFIERALEHLSSLSDSLTYWDEKYKLFLDLYSLAAEVEFYRGNFEKNEAHVDVVLTYARQKEDAIRVLVCRALSYGVRREFIQAIKESKRLLKLLGVKMPRSLTINVIMELVKTKGAMKKKANKDIIGLPTMVDEKIKVAMQILMQGSIFGWNSDTTFAGLCYLRMIRLTMKYGWCETTPYALAGYGFMLAALGEENEAFRFSQLAIQSSKTKRALPEVHMMTAAFISHFERPAALSLPSLIDGYRSGLESGNMMCGTICMSVYAHVYLFSGLSLTTFEKDMMQFSQQLKLCHQDLALAFVLPALQLALNLSGKSNDPMDVSVNSMQQLVGYNDSMFVDTTVEDPSVLFVYYLQAFSAYLLGDLDKASRALDHIYARKMTRLDGTQILNIFFIAIDGLISLGLKRERPRHQKHRGLARSSVKALVALTKKRSVNCHPVLSLLHAENASFATNNVDVLKTKYAHSIQLLTRSGFLHYTAIANELAGKAMLRSNDEYWAEYYLLEAAVKYTEWGAIVKVHQMKKAYPSIDFDKRKTRESTAMHSRQWFDANVDSVEARLSWASNAMTSNRSPRNDTTGRNSMCRSNRDSMTSGVFEAVIEEEVSTEKFSIDSQTRSADSPVDFTSNTGTKTTQTRNVAKKIERMMNISLVSPLNSVMAGIK